MYFDNYCLVDVLLYMGNNGLEVVMISARDISELIDRISKLESGIICW